MRDITQIFISRAELLPAGETIEDYKKSQQEEADIVEKDRKNDGRGGGLFGGRFKHSRHHNTSAIRDLEDGVDRCPRCAWELMDEGYCTSCGYEIDYPTSGSDSLSGSDIRGGDDSAFLVGDEMGAFDSLDSETMSALEESVHGGDIIPLGNLNHRAYSRMSADVESRRQALRPHVLGTSLNRAPRPRFPSVFTTGAVTDDEFGNTDDYSSEEDDAGSLRNFVVDENEIEDEHSEQLSPQSSHYDSDEASGIFEALGSYSSDGQSDLREAIGISREGGPPEPSHRFSLESHGFSPECPNFISVEDDESDEGPVLRSRVRAQRRPLASLNSNRSDEADNASVVRPHSSRRRSTRDSRSQTSRESSLRFHSRNIQTAAVSESSSTGLRAESIETESDSDTSPVIQRPRPRRGRSAPSSVISDDEDEATTISSDNNSAPSRQSSSGTMTIGRPSPTRPGFRAQADLATVEPPIVLSSSPGRLNPSTCQ